MNEALDKLKKEVTERIDTIKFHPHFYIQKIKRPYLTEELVKNALSNVTNYLGFQIEEVRGIKRYRVGIQLSRKHIFVVVIEIEKEVLYIITAWKTNRKWQKALLK